MVQWEETESEKAKNDPTYKKKAVDKDSPTDMQWICDRAIERADNYGISGVNYKLTMGVVKNIIPAIASTNALISAACVNECMKVLTGCNNRLDSYMQFLGQSRTTCSAVAYERQPDCLVCGSHLIKATAKQDEKLSEFLERLNEANKFKGPTITPNEGEMLIGTGFFKNQTEHKLGMTFSELIAAGKCVKLGANLCSMSDPNVPVAAMTLALTIE
jgi:ubiquitin-activating enzyme E1 C